ncbi:MAG: hypothetical protein N2Z22_10115 [Turneriella sp.]|nr:hypothetical protein [Turneriella sp.]
MATPQERAQQLIREFIEFNEKYAAQIPLAIPKGTLRTIDSYRDTYFRYLKDSEFKSNICYMLQLLEFELWLYRLFKPQYSLESALFFQLLITQGLVIEAVVFAIVVDPLIVPDPHDRSKGNSAKEHHNLMQFIRRRTFAMHIQQLRSLKIISEELAQELDSYRSEIRNLVHLQNWEGRLYRQISLEEFSRHLEKFEQLLKKLSQEITTTPALAQLLSYYQLDGSRVTGTIRFFNRSSGRGQIDARAPHDFIPFFVPRNTADFKRGDLVSFVLELTPQGIRACQLEPYLAAQ